MPGVRQHLKGVLRERFPSYESLYEQLGWKICDGIDRVYVNAAARRDLGWSPEYDFASVLARLEAGDDPNSPRRWQSAPRAITMRFSKTVPTPWRMSELFVYGRLSTSGSQELSGLAHSIPRARYHATESWSDSSSGRER